MSAPRRRKEQIMNNVCLIGNFVADPQRYEGTSRSGNNYVRCTFTLAVQRTQTETDFIRCICFDKVANSTMKHMHKGDRAAITGSIRTGSYVNKDGQRVYTTDVSAYTVEFLSTPKGTTNDRDGGLDNGDGGFDESQAFMAFEDDIVF